MSDDPDLARRLREATEAARRAAEAEQASRLAEILKSQPKG